MAITTLFVADDGSTSLQKINDNFAFLDTNSVSVSGTQTLTNKTIDAANNTLLNIPYSALDSALLTGTNTTVVSGTAGVANNLGAWSAAGDMVDAGAALDSDATLGGGAASNTKVPTQLAVKSYVDSVAGITMVLTPTGGNGTTTGQVGNEYGVILYNSTGDDASFSFVVPSATSFSIQDVKLYVTHNTTSGVNYTIDTYVDYASSGQLYDQASATVLGVTTGSLSNKEVAVLDLTSAFSGVAAGDLVTMRCELNAATGAISLGIHKLVVTLA